MQPQNILHVYTKRCGKRHTHTQMNLNGTPKEDPGMQNKAGKWEGTNPERTNSK